jgi:hypothetical protein
MIAVFLGCRGWCRGTNDRIAARQPRTIAWQELMAGLRARGG